MKLITGGCGFIGSNAAAHYLDRGEHVIVLDNLYRHGAVQNLDWLQSLPGAAQRLTFHPTDIRDRDAVLAVLQQHPVQTVLHFAGQVAATTSVADPAFDFDVNALGTFNVCEAVRRCAPDAQLVFSSTNKVYGDLARHAPAEGETRFTIPALPDGCDEDTPLDFHSPYGCSKGAADQYVRDYGRIYNLRTVVLRLSTIYGGRQFATYDQGWIGWFTQQVADNRAFTITGKGKQVRDILHISDLLTLLDRLDAQRDRIAAEIFNIGGGPRNTLSPVELVRHLYDVTGKRPPYELIAERPGDQPVYISDVRKALRLLDWTPTISPSDGVARMLEWIGKAGAASTV